MDNLASQFGPVLAPTSQLSGGQQADLGKAAHSGPDVSPGVGPPELVTPHLPQRQPIGPGTPPGLLSTDITEGDETSEPVPAGGGTWTDVDALGGPTWQQV